MLYLKMGVPKLDLKSSLSPSTWLSTFQIFFTMNKVRNPLVQLESRSVCPNGQAGDRLRRHQERIVIMY